MTLMDRILLRRRAIVESVIDQLKNISQIEHSRHRSVVNFMVNMIVRPDRLCSSAQEAVVRSGNPCVVARLTRTDVYYRVMELVLSWRSHHW